MDKSAPSARLHALDLIRGGAAIAVMLYHAGRIVPRGYLAVDLFFLLSGFVLFRAYAGRLAQGEVGSLIVRRAVRLGPLFIVGLGVGWAINGVPSNAPGYLFPQNIPLWSLVFEVIASVAFVLLFRFGPVVWSLIFSAGLYYTVIGILDHGSADLGYRWNTAHYGLARTAFAFCLGIAIARMPSFRLTSWLAVPLVASMLAVMMIPRGNLVVDLLAVFVLFPAGVALLVQWQMPAVRLVTYLGAASYALYAIHHPVVKWVMQAEWPLLPVLVALPLVALAIDRMFDAPVRRWLAARVEARGSEGRKVQAL